MILTPPDNIAKRNLHYHWVFLAGTIDNGSSDDWQLSMANFFELNKWGVFNPRRPDWDSSWVQDFDNPHFYQQVNWELDAMHRADLIVMHFLPNSISPISLLELGLYAQSDKIRVVSPPGFWRKGNVDIVCNRYNIPLYDNIQDFKEAFLKNFR